MGLGRGSSGPAGLGWVRSTREVLLGACEESKFYSSFYSSDTAIPALVGHKRDRQGTKLSGAGLGTGCVQ